MNTRILLAACSSLALAITVKPALAAGSCEDLAHIKAAGVTINTAATVDSLASIANNLGQAKVPTPFCRVNGFITPTKDSHIGFEVWLPAAGAWNHKFEAVGNGGLSGALNYRAMLNGFGRGYATMTTDLGHTNTPPNSVEDATWAMGHPEKVIDYAYRGEHLSTLAAKQIVQAYYGSASTHAYYSGCSAGGIQGLTEVLRFPKDFDGYIIGDATPDHMGQEIGALWNTLQASLANPVEALKPAQISLVHKEILKQCVGKDGGAPADAFLTDPTACQFEPKALQCKDGQDPAACLSAAQVEIFEKIYGGPVDSHTHQFILAGMSLGSEAGWDRYFAGKKNPADAGRPWAGFLVDMVYSDPNYLEQEKYLSFDFGNGYEALRRTKIGGEALDSSWNTRNRDLDAFKQAGGKIIQYHGWDDPNIPSLEAVRFFTSVMADQARRHRLTPDQALEATQQFLRLFLVPGMGHCMGGDGLTAFGQSERGATPDAEHDSLAALERWVEQGVAPAQILATRVDAKSGNVEMSRPVCAYPKAAVWNGSGNAAEATSFACMDTHPAALKPLGSK
jgi:feruloyl esterase